MYGSNHLKSKQNQFKSAGGPWAYFLEGVVASKHDSCWIVRGLNVGVSKAESVESVASFNAAVG